MAGALLLDAEVRLEVNGVVDELLVVVVVVVVVVQLLVVIVFIGLDIFLNN